jgi:hypothetical protein
VVFLPDPSWVIRIALISEFLQMVWDGITYNMVSETGYGIWVWYGIVGWITEQDSIHTYTLGANTHKHTHTRMYVCIHVHRCMYVYIYILRSYITSFIIPTIPSLKGYIMVYIHTHVFIYVKSFAYIYIQIWMKCNNSSTRNELMSYWGVTRLPVLVSSWYFTHDQICRNFLF